MRKPLVTGASRGEGPEVFAPSPGRTEVPLDAQSQVPPDAEAGLRATIENRPMSGIPRETEVDGPGTRRVDPARDARIDAWS